MFMKLNTDTWKDFRFGDLLSDIYKAKAHAKIELTTSDNKKEDYIPFVTRTEENNSVDCYALKSDLQHIEEGNAIVIGDTTSTISYQPEPFGTGDHIIVLRADWINSFTALFIISVLKEERFRYSYGRAFLMNLIKDTRIFLPIDKKGYPDWGWIEKFIQSLKSKNITTKNLINSSSLLVNSWKEYQLKFLFNFRKGTRLTKEDMEDGNVNYLGAISGNNGVRQKISCQESDLYAPNCITVNYNGSVGEAFYQKDPFWASDDVNVLYAKEWWQLNVYRAMFIITIIKANKYKFDYGRKWTMEKMKESTILLPSKTDGTPDWEWMENYIKSLPYSDRI